MDKGVSISKRRTRLREKAALAGFMGKGMVFPYGTSGVKD